MTTAAPREDTRTGRPGKFRVAALVLVAAAGGFGAAFYGAPLVLPPATAALESDAVLDAGSFPVDLPGQRLQLVSARVTVRSGVSAPEGPAGLHDAMLVLLAEATDLPLVRDGRGSLEDLEAVVLSMAEASAPWLAGLDLAPAEEATEPGAEEGAAEPAGH